MAKALTRRKPKKKVPLDIVQWEQAEGDLSSPGPSSDDVDKSSPPPTVSSSDGITMSTDPLPSDADDIAPTDEPPAQTRNPTSSSTKLTYIPLHPIHLAELASLWPADPRIPTPASRKAWAEARGVNPVNVHSWWYRRRKLAKKFKMRIPMETYEVEVGEVPELPVVEVEVQEEEMKADVGEDANEDNFEGVKDEEAELDVQMDVEGAFEAGRGPPSSPFRELYELMLEPVPPRKLEAESSMPDIPASPLSSPPLSPMALPLPMSTEVADEDVEIEPLDLRTPQRSSATSPLPASSPLLSSPIGIHLNLRSFDDDLDLESDAEGVKGDDMDEELEGRSNSTVTTSGSSLGLSSPDSSDASSDNTSTTSVDADSTLTSADCGDPDGISKYADKPSPSLALRIPSSDDDDKDEEMTLLEFLNTKPEGLWIHIPVLCSTDCSDGGVDGDVKDSNMDVKEYDRCFNEPFYPYKLVFEGRVDPEVSAIPFLDRFGWT